MTVVVVGGGRDLQDRDLVFRTLDYWHARLAISLLVQGGQVAVHPDDRRKPDPEQRRWGADYLAKRWAMARGIPNVEDKLTDADWKKFGQAAGATHTTKLLMKHKPERVLAFPGGEEVSELLDQARRAGVKCIEVC